MKTATKTPKEIYTSLMENISRLVREAEQEMGLQASEETSKE